MPDPVAVVGTDLRSEVLKPQVWGLGVVLGMLLMIPGCVAGGAVGLPFVGGLVGLVGTVLVVVGGIGYVYLNTRYTFYKDRVAVDSPVGTEVVTYDEVAVALRTSDEADAEYDTADITLVREGDDALSMPNALQPDTVKQILEAHLPSATEWLDERDERRTALRALVRRRREREQALGEGAIVLPGTLVEEWVGLDPDKMSYDELNEIDDVDDLSDVDPDDLLGVDVGEDDEDE